MVNKLLCFVVGAIAGALASNYISGFYAGMQGMACEENRDDCKEEDEYYGI